MNDNADNRNGHAQNEARQALDRLWQALHKTIDVVRESKERISNLESEADRVRSAVESKNALLAAAEANRLAAAQELERIKKDLTGRNSQLEQNYSLVREKAAFVPTLTKEVDELRAVNETLEARVAELEKEIETRFAQKAEFELTQKEITRKNLELYARSNENAALNESNAELRSKLFKLKRVEKDLKTALENNQTLAEALNEKESEALRLGSQLEEARLALEQTPRLNSRIAELENANSELGVEINSLRPLERDLSESRAQLALVHRDLASTRASRAIAEEAQRRIAGDRDVLREQRNALQSMFEDLKAKYAELQNSLAGQGQSSKKVSELENEIRKLNADLQIKTNLLYESRNYIREQDKKIQLMIAESSRRESELKNCEAKIREMDASAVDKDLLEERRIELAELKSQYEEKIHETNALIKTNEELVELADKRNLQIEALESEINKYLSDKNIQSEKGRLLSIRLEDFIYRIDKRLKA